MISWDRLPKAQANMKRLHVVLLGVLGIVSAAALVLAVLLLRRPSGADVSPAPAAVATIQPPAAKVLVDSSTLQSLVHRADIAIATELERTRLLKPAISLYERPDPPTPVPVHLSPPTLPRLPVPTPDLHMRSEEGYVAYPIAGIQPISFALHSSVKPVFQPTRSRAVAPCFPGQRQTYVFRREEEYYRQYGDAWFGLTCKKSGWDCLRHYEIAACGCIPVFLDLEAMPNTCMMNWDRQLLTRARNLYARLASRIPRDWSVEDGAAVRDGFGALANTTVGSLKVRDRHIYFASANNTSFRTSTQSM